MKPVVLFSVKTPDERTNPFIILLSRSVSSAVDVVYFSWSRALFGPYNVLHVHWPENLFRATGSVRPIKGFLAWILLVRLAVLKVRIVWTVHNEAPHERGGILERLFLRVFTRLVTHHIALSDAQMVSFPTNWNSLVIPHGHYRTWLHGTDKPAQVEERVLFWGLMRPYKGIESLISIFRHFPSRSASLRLVGLPSTKEFEKCIAGSIADDNRISAEFTYATDDLLMDEISECVLNVLPYKRMGNSGVALYTLSLNRPILVPDSPYAKELQKIVGNEWVYIFPNELTTERLEASLHAAAGVAGRVPDLSYFDWDDIGASYIELYLMGVR